MNPEQWKLWSEVAKNLAELLALAGGALALRKWFGERDNRATDVLLRIERDFGREKVKRGRDLIDSDSSYLRHASAISQCISKRTGDDDIDALLRFYVVLYGIRLTNQVPTRALSVCFRYWLAHYFRNDRKEFHDHVDTFYPTLKQWLNEDCPPCEREKWGEGFFRPTELFRAELLDTGTSASLSNVRGPFAS